MPSGIAFQWSYYYVIYYVNSFKAKQVAKGM